MSFLKFKNSSKKERKESFFGNFQFKLTPLSAVYTDKAPKPVGPYSQAVSIQINLANLMFFSGQIPLDPETSQVVGEDISAQSRQVFENIKAILESYRMGFSDVVKTLVFLTEMKDFESFNRVYEEYFKNHKPARSCVEVSKLPKGVKVEVEVIAYK